MPYSSEARQEFETIADGDYEVFIEDASEKFYPSGKHKISVRYRMRDDLEQQYPKRCLFEDIWQDHKDKGEYDEGHVARLMATQPGNVVLEDTAALLAYLRGLELIVHVETRHNSFLNRDVSYVVSYKKTEYPTKDISEDQDKAAEGSEDMAAEGDENKEEQETDGTTDDQLPF